MWTIPPLTMDGDEDTDEIMDGKILTQFGYLCDVKRTNCQAEESSNNLLTNCLINCCKLRFRRVE